MNNKNRKKYSSNDIMNNYINIDNNSIKHNIHDHNMKYLTNNTKESSSNNVHNFLANCNLGPGKLYRITSCNENFTKLFESGGKKSFGLYYCDKDKEPHTNTCQPPEDTTLFFQPPENTTLYFQPPEDTTLYSQEPKDEVLNSSSFCYYVPPQQTTSCKQPCNQPIVCKLLEKINQPIKQFICNKFNQLVSQPCNTSNEQLNNTPSDYSISTASDFSTSEHSCTCSINQTTDQTSCCVSEELDEPCLIQARNTSTG